MNYSKKKAMDLMMADDERRAEIEAVARALYEQGFGFNIDADPVARESMFSVARVVLDRVRDARSDDECNCYSRAFKNPMQHAPTCPARSPQGEDHEAGKALLNFIRANRSWFCGGKMMEPYESRAAEKLSAYLSRVSPSRVGSVAVEDVERLKNELQALVDWFNDAPFLRAERLLYDLSRSSTDDQPNGERVMCEREVEAVARDAIAWIRDGFPLTAAKLQERLDRVRDARGDDEGYSFPGGRSIREARSPQGEDHEHAPDDAFDWVPEGTKGRHEDYIPSPMEVHAQPYLAHRRAEGLRAQAKETELNALEDDVRYERERAERLEEQLAEAKAMCDHNQRVANEAQQRADDLADLLEMSGSSIQDEVIDEALVELALKEGGWPQSDWGRGKMKRSLEAVFSHLKEQ